MNGELTLRMAAFDDLSPATLYALLKLRVDVFVVEQQCPYPDLDGRDTEPATRHFWFEQDREPKAYLRVITDQHAGEPAARIGRVVTAKDARGQGLAGKLVAAALAVAGKQPCVLDAQSHLVELYRKYGFETTGPEYLDDGIPHVPMLRLAR